MYCIFDIYHDHVLHVLHVLHVYHDHVLHVLLMTVILPEQLGGCSTIIVYYYTITLYHICCT